MLLTFSNRLVPGSLLCSNLASQDPLLPYVLTSERYNLVLQQLLDLQAEISGQSMGQGITQSVSNTSSVAPTGGQTLDNAQSEIQSFVNNLA